MTVETENARDTWAGVAKELGIDSERIEHIRSIYDGAQTDPQYTIDPTELDATRTVVMEALDAMVAFVPATKALAASHGYGFACADGQMLVVQLAYKLLALTGVLSEAEAMTLGSSYVKQQSLPAELASIIHDLANMLVGDVMEQISDEDTAPDESAN